MSKRPRLRFLVGTYSQAEDKGIYQVEWDTESLAACVSRVSTQERASWMVRQGPWLYAASEILPNSRDLGKIQIYRMDPSELTPLHVVTDLPHILVHLCLMPEENRLFAVSYGTGDVLSFQIEGDGYLTLADRVIHKGKSLHPIRQACAHPHSIWLCPDGRHLCMCDLGTDELLIYRNDNGRLVSCPEKTVSFPAGYGVRHLAFSEDGTKAYVVTELKYHILVLDWEGDGNFKICQDIDLCPDMQAQEHSGGAVRVFGDMLYCTNRGAKESRIDWMKIGPDGIPHSAGHIHSGCECPRDIVITPDGRYLLCANQRGNAISIYQRSEMDGGLTYLASLPGIPSPCCMLIVS